MQPDLQEFWSVDIVSQAVGNCVELLYTQRYTKAQVVEHETGPCVDVQTGQQFDQVQSCTYQTTLSRLLMVTAQNRADWR